MSNSNINDFNESKIDAIGEIENISMGAAATAISTLLNAKVWITTPKVKVCKASEFSYPDLEPSIFVRIKYVEGIKGSSLLILKQDDVQLILNQLMGMPLVVSENFEFDEINISAVCEVMNQMMGASATALSKIINTFIDISTPEAIINMEDHNILELQEIDANEYICAVSFMLTIEDVISSKFVTILSMDLARDMADKMISTFNSEIESNSSGGSKQSLAPPPSPPRQTTSPPPVDAPAAQPPKSASMPLPQQSMQQQFVSFENTLSQEELNNLQLLLNVPLELSIEIGSTQKKVDEILSFSHGTVIELDCPADTPVNVIVNGYLIAKGDVVVVDDHFAVRITEIIQSNLLDTLRNKE